MKKKMIIFIVIIILLGICGVNAIKRKNTTPMERTFSTRPFNQIQIDDQADDITFKTGNKYQVIYTGRKNLKPHVAVKKSVLNIESQHGKIVFNGSFFNLFGASHSLLGQSITIEMPKKELKKLNLQAQNGKISAEYLNVRRGKIESSNGKIDINNLITKKGLYISLDNGAVQINHNNASGYDLSLDNGHINFAGKNKGDEYEHDSSSKNVLTIELTNGKIDVN